MALSFAAFSTAQYTDLTPKNMSFRGGFGYMLEDSTRSETGTMFALGADFNSEFSLVKGSVGYFSIDYYAKSIGGRTKAIVPIMWNQRFAMGNQEGMSTYFFAGAGAVSVDVFGQKWVPGGRLGIGSNLGQHVFAEVTLLLSSDANDAKANSLGLFLGYRF